MWLLLPLLFTSAVCLPFDGHSAFTPAHLSELKNVTRELFRHSWSAYMDHGFPADEVRPLTCEPYGPDYANIDNSRNDAMGNTLLTVLDNLDTLVIMEQWDELEVVLTYLHANQATLFAQDSVVQVFEATIRWLGGLMSAHLLLTETKWEGPRYTRIAAIAAAYDGFLLVLAYDLGLRLIPAFTTATELPYPRINLARGLGAVPNRLNRETCTSGATTPLVEFTLLLRLTGDAQFERHASRTFWKLWLLRLPIGLMPMSLDPKANGWLDSVTGIGALIDSFYEYAAKGAILFNDNFLWRVFLRSYRALLMHLAQSYGSDGPTYFANVNTDTAGVVSDWIDLLGAFWGGVQVLVGRLSDAVNSHVIYMKIWDAFDLIPERWAMQPPAIALEWYPLRPEFIESTYYLFRATRDPMYLQVGLRVLSLFERHFKAPCGLAGVQDIRTGERQNRMETFVTSELLKYLYLLFDEANECFLHSPSMTSKNWVFSTEAHPLWYTDRMGAESSRLFREHLQLRVAVPSVHEHASFFDRLWRRFSKNQMSEIDLVHDEPKQRYEPIIEAPIAPAQLFLDVCEVGAHQLKTDTPSMHSGYYSWNQLFWTDQRFQSTLKRPKHLPRTPGSCIELTPSFYQAYSNGNPQCPRSHTTSEIDFVLGMLLRPEDLDIYTIKSDTAIFKRGDIVMPLLSGRIRMESLVPGTVDSTNIDITKDYIRRVRPNSWASSKSVVLRINRLNGYLVGRERTVWTARANVEGQADMYKISPDGRVYIQTQYVENLRVY